MSRLRKTASEHCWILLGQHRPPLWLARRHRPTVGSSVEVEFDGAWVLAREEKRGDVVGFLHTHPSGPARPSERDLRTMRAWVAAFGKPLLCVIVSPRGQYAGVFAPGERQPRELTHFQQFPNHYVVGVDADGRPVSP